jgi:uncharacterized protein (DUF2147 family)
MTRLCSFIGPMALVLMATNCGAEEIVGTWQSDEGTMRVKFESCGQATCGDVVWVKPGGDTKATFGQRLFSDMRPDGESSWRGKANYNGSIYVSTMSLRGSVLTTTGCVMAGLLCKSDTWRKSGAR